MPSTNACNLCLTRLQDIFLRSRNCWGGLYPLRNMCHNVSQNIFAPHFRVWEERHIWWLDYLWPASQPTCLRSCLSAYDQCHPPSLSHGHASAITKNFKLKVCLSHQASFAKQRKYYVNVITCLQIIIRPRSFSASFNIGRVSDDVIPGCQSSQF